MRACGVKSVFKITEAHRMGWIRLINCERQNVPANRNGETLSRETSMATDTSWLVFFWVSNYEKSKSTNSFSWRTISASYFTVLYRKWYTQSVCTESSLVCCTSLLRHKFKWIFYNFRQMTGAFWLYLTPSLSRTRIWFVCKLVVLLSVVYTFNYWKKYSNDIQSDGDDIRRILSSDWLTRAGNVFGQSYPLGMIRFVGLEEIIFGQIRLKISIDKESSIILSWPSLLSSFKIDGCITAFPVFLA